MTPKRLLIHFCSILVYSLVLTPAALAGDDWKPIDPAQLAMKTPVVEKDADAEVLFWEVRVKDEVDYGEAKTVFWHYLRIKIFTDRGKESQGRVDIPYTSRTKITDIAGRTIKPDGSIVELKKDSVFERTIVKYGGLKLKAKSFAMPAVEAGCIIEYRYREVSPLSGYVRLDFYQEIPVQKVKYYIKPYSSEYFPFGMRSMGFHAKFPPFFKEKDGFYSTELTNIPALSKEPKMPPEKQVSPWMLIYYSEDRKLNPEQYWRQRGKELYEKYKSVMKPNDDVKRAAASVVGDLAAPEQKLEKLFDYCKTKIKNINRSASGLTDEERAKLKKNDSPADTLKRGMGTSFDIDILFGALAIAAGFDARFAMLADRGDVFFDPSIADDYFMNFYLIAVKVGGEWRFYDPAVTYIPFGMLAWQAEATQAIISDPKEQVFVRTPLSGPEKSLEKRVGTFTLNEDGTMEGDVRIEYSGHLGAQEKNYNDDDSEAEREKTLSEMIKKRMSTAEVSNITIDNVTDPAKPFVYAFHVRVPGYAQRTGKRLFLQPGFFQKGIEAMFPITARKHEVYFHYPWTEEDSVKIALPRGFELDHAEQPSPLRSGDVANYEVHISVVNKNEQLLFSRKLRFNGLLFPVASYPAVKQLFDLIHESDNHTISLKQAVTAST